MFSGLTPILSNIFAIYPTELEVVAESVIPYFTVVPTIEVQECQNARAYDYSLIAVIYGLVRVQAAIFSRDSRRLPTRGRIHRAFAYNLDQIVPAHLRRNRSGYTQD